MNYLAVFVGGGLGSLCRYGIAQLLVSYNFVFPFATFFANVLSCIILGFMVGLSLKSDWTTPFKLLTMTGFCGGFSTFSTFSKETFLLFQDGNINYAFGNIGINIIICLIAIYSGILLSKLLSNI